MPLFVLAFGLSFIDYGKELVTHEYYSENAEQYCVKLVSFKPRSLGAARQ